MLLITSFNSELYKLYGKRMTEEFSEKSDGTVKLVVVFEGDAIPDFQLKNVQYIKFEHPDHRAFINKFGNLYEARGYKINFLENNEIQLTQDYRFDAIRFSFKIFSILQAIDVFHPLDYFAWIDADVRCLNKFSLADLLEFFPQDEMLMSYLGRNKFPEIPYSECGFLGFNNRHPKIKEFLNRVAAVYRDGEIFSFDQWHDSWIWDQIRLEFELKQTTFKNISGSAMTTDHPFINSRLGLFFDHLKGPQRKHLGNSFPEDYKFGLRN